MAGERMLVPISDLQTTSEKLTAIVAELESAAAKQDDVENAVGRPYTEAQISALLRLLDDLTTRLGIPKTQVIGHADLAPTRKRDPGALFPWQQLAAAGYGLWPQGALVEPPAGFDPWLAMAAVGYPLGDRAAAVRAFHRHYRGHDDGEDPQAAFDAEDLRILYALAQQRMAMKP